MTQAMTPEELRDLTAKFMVVLMVLWCENDHEQLGDLTLDDVIPVVDSVFNGKGELGDPDDFEDGDLDDLGPSLN